MKYIRTTDNIYENNQHINKVRFIEKNDEEYFCLSINLGYSADGFHMTRNERIIKESDNLKDLCDCAVYISKCYSELEPEIYYDWERMYFDHQYEEELGVGTDMCEVYGAIWVKGKGLIFVAKMNENEDLCLI